MKEVAQEVQKIIKETAKMKVGQQIAELQKTAPEGNYRALIDEKW